MNRENKLFGYQCSPLSYRLKPIKNYFYICILFLSLPACSGIKSDTLTELPICPDASEIKYNYDYPQKGVNTLTYIVTTPFPADEVISYIDKEIQLKGFKRYKIPRNTPPYFSWIYNPGNYRWEKAVKAPAKYFASWVNNQKDEIVMAWIDIGYPYDSTGSSMKETATINLNITRFSEAEKLMLRTDKLMNNPPPIKIDDSPGIPTRGTQITK